ncbi:MAG: TIGR04211 family SH3 domain-containing protein [Methylococcales bacterium]|nr:TIGR04211 family SH3 domain-containing protein [Methylococcales bacterium]
MKIKTLSSFIILMATCGSAWAETVYVTDNLNLSLKSEESMKSKPLKPLSIGTPLTFIKENKKSGFTKVRLDNIEGYIETKRITREPPLLHQTEASNKIQQSLQAENNALKAELDALKKSITPGTSLEQSLARERDQLSRELAELKKTAASSIQLKNDRDQLQERIVSVERDLEQFKLENEALKDTANQDWFLYGGALVFAGVILGFILPKLGWRRKSSWDSY